MKKKKSEEFEKKKKQFLSITQILILVIGILSFSFIIGEIGKQQGIEISRGIGVVGAEAVDEDCSPDGKTVCPLSGPGLFCQNGKWIVDPEEECIEETDTSEIDVAPETETETMAAPQYTYDKDFRAKDEEGNEYRVPDSTDSNDDGELDKKESDNLLKKGWNGIKDVGGAALTYDQLSKAAGGQGLKIFSKPAGEGITHIAKGKLVGGGEPSKLAHGNLQYAGPAIGAFLAWAIFKWILNGDVRNMRTITAVAFATGAAGIITALAIGSTAVPGIGWIVGGIVLALVLIFGAFTWQNYSQETFNYIVTAWKAPAGGTYCNLCNDIEFGCSEYQCRSFGKACEIVNEGTTQQACVWKDPDDIFPPTINESDKYLPSEDYNYLPLAPLYGVKVNYADDPTGKGCAPAYSSIKFGIETDKYADCKIDTERTPSYGEMTAPLPKAEDKAGKEHFLELPHVATPSVEAQQAAGISFAIITNGQDQQFYIRCESVNGYSNLDEYIVEFCVQDGPDTLAPVILGTNFPQNGFWRHGDEEQELQIYTNEPAECKWSFENLDYNAMQFEMDSCSQSEGDYMFSPFGYGCIGTLTGMKDNVENKVHIKCKDKPWWTEGDKVSRYENEQPYILTLQGTEPLLIDKITVNDKTSGAIIKDSVSTMNIKLEAKAKFGAESGKARCQYEFGGNWINFYNGGSVEFVNVNTQRIPLSEGFYNYSIRCYDAANNFAQENIEFTLEADNTPPIVARAYYDVNNLKVITNEPAECVYTLQTNIGCAYNFDDGTAMSEIGELVHYTSWQAGKKYFIKCKDAFGNQPLPGQCGIIVKAFESYD